MKQVPLWAFYKIGYDLKAIERVTSGMLVREAKETLVQSWRALQFLLFEQEATPLHDCRSAALALQRQMNEIYVASTEDESATVRDSDIKALAEKLQRFEIIFQNELASLPAFCVGDKGIFSTRKLIFVADEGLDTLTRSRLSEVAKSDLKSAGRCLAFELPTASGFHMMRAVEATCLSYLSRFPSTENKRDLGIYIAMLKTRGASDETVFALDHLRKLKRNPLMHPEDVLTDAEAIVLFQQGLVAIQTTIADGEARGIFGSVS